MGILNILRGNKFKQFPFHFQYIFTGRNSGPVGDPEYMSIHRYGLQTKGGIQYYVGRFTAHPRQFFQVIAIIRYPAAMFLHQDPAGFHDVFRLGVIQANGFDMAFQTPGSEL